MPSGMTQVIHELNALDLSTLAAGDLVATDSNKIIATREQGCFIEKMKLAWYLQGLTAGEGPLWVGLAIDMSDAEIEEALESAPQHVDDVPASEQANRKVFPMWLFGKDTDDDGQPVPVREVTDWPFKEIPEGQALRFWAYNGGGGTLTTGAGFNIAASYVTRWLRD